MSPNSLKIAIIGGGPGGLALARLLHVKNIQFTVFERDASPSVRSQGGTLDIHEETGQRTLKEAGLWDTISQSLRYEGEAMIVVDENNTRVMENLEGGSNRPELDRQVLRKVLIESIPEGMIRWGTHVKAVTEDGLVQLASGEEESGFDLIVGADGTWSKVRPLLSPSVPSYASISGMDVRLPNVDQNHPSLSKLVGPGTFFALGNNLTMIAQRNGDGSVRTYLWGRRTEDWIHTCGINFNDPPAAKASILKDYVAWAPELQPLITASDEIVPRAIYGLPVDHSWVTKPGFTLLGDAAHVMPPNGEGVNLALIDALDLAEAVSAYTHSGEISLTQAVEEFEKKMINRSRRSAIEGAELLDVMFSTNAAVKFKNMFDGMMAKAGEGPSTQ